MQKLTFNTKIGNQMQNLYCRNVRNVKFPKIVAEKFAFYNFNQIDEKRRTAIYVRISTAMQKTDRQVEELVAFAKSNRLNFDESTDIYKDIISGFKDGEDRPNFSILMAKLEMGEYTQVLFSEFSHLERKPTNLLRDLEKFQSLGIY